MTGTVNGTWPFLDPRMDRERVVRICYVVARLGYFWCADCGFIFFKRKNTARQYPARLVKRGLLETFPRRSLADSHVYRVSERALEWLVDEIGCDPSDVWRPASLRRLNVPAARAMNRFWCSLVAACEGSPIRLHRFVPERQLRRFKAPGCPVVPDALFVLEASAEGGAEGASRLPWFVEQDNSTERLKVWAEKIRGYRSNLPSGRLYGMRDWLLLVLAPTRKRAANISRTAVAAGGGDFTYVAIAAVLEGGHALDAVLWRASTLAADANAVPTDTLVSAARSTSRPTSTTPVRPDGLSQHLSGGIP
ncbi:MAG: replication-relaxation family protein [Polyangia bacterium]